jgi:diaminopropionate ammonia-lyase
MATQSADEIAATLSRLSPTYRPTPLLDLPGLARRLGVAQVLAKDEGRRALGSFKSLGGTYAGLRALARHAGCDVAGLIGRAPRRSDRPALICASDGNHGLAVAYAARLADAPARVFLHAGVPAWRAERIAGEGAEIVWVDGTYDDAVDQAAAAARDGGILIADTSADIADPVVADVMAGYGVIAAEIRAQVEASGEERPSHLFVQAGVGGLAAALAEGLVGWMAEPGRIVVVEPEAVACVAAALSRGSIERMTGPLETSAEMLSCGEASAPAFAILRRLGAVAVTLGEDELREAPRVLTEEGGPAASPSGATGLAGLIRAAEAADRLGIGPDSRVVLIVSEGATDDPT